MRLPRFITRWLTRLAIKRAHRNLKFRQELQDAVIARVLIEPGLSDIDAIRWIWPKEDWRGPVIIANGKRIDTTELLYTDTWRDS